MTGLCLLLAITFYSKLPPAVDPVSHQWAIVPASKLSDLRYMLHHTSYLYGHIEREWNVPWSYCQREGFSDDNQ